MPLDGITLVVVPVAVPGLLHVRVPLQVSKPQGTAPPTRLRSLAPAVATSSHS